MLIQKKSAEIMQEVLNHAFKAQRLREKYITKQNILLRDWYNAI
jgi:hypothetical protein